MNKTERCVGYYLDEMDANSDFRPDASALKGGSVLEALLERLDARRDDKTLYAVMRCLRDSELYVKRDSDDWLTDRGHRYLKAYSKTRDGGEARCVSASELFKTVKASRELYGVAVEPEAHGFLLGPDLLEILLCLPSEL